MNYHLYRNGRDEGVFPLTVLVCRLKAGELSTQDMVWCEGMTDWQPIGNFVPPPIPTPSPTLRRLKRRLPHAVSSGPVLESIIAVVILTIIAWAAYVGMTVYKQMRVVTRGLNSQVSADTGESAVVIASKPAVWNTNGSVEADWTRKHEHFGFDSTWKDTKNAETATLRVTPRQLL